MFSARKYSPLPTSSNGQHRKRAGGLPVWKRYLLLGACGAFVVVGGYFFLGRGERSVLPPQTYTPNLDNPPVNDEEFQSPDFNPVPHVSDEDKGKELHILPIDGGSPNLDGDKTDVSFEQGDFKEDVEDDEEPPKAHRPSKPSSSSGAKHPTSFETDENPESTSYCSKPFVDTKPLVQYALTIDAGSTGSRIHVYKFHNCEASPQLEYETFMMLKPGLSSYKDDPTAAAASLDKLMDEADRVVPAKLRHCTPVEVKATAGLRLLGETQSAAILDEVRSRLETKYKYSVSKDKKAIEIMDGKDEGVYAWITANYLLGKIGEGAKTTDTLAVMDLGGASTQIVFEPKFATKEKLTDGDHKYQLSFSGKDYTLYQHSHLNYGLMRARRRVHNLVAFSYSFSQDNLDWDTLSADHEISNPCLSHGTTRTVLLDPPGRSAVNVTMHGGNGGYEACNRFIELALAKDAICEVQPCSFNGVYQPSILDTFKEGKFLALSYFTDRIAPLLPEKAAGSLTLATLKDLAQDVCAGADKWAERWGDNKKAMEELSDRPEYCLDLTFMHGLLGLGYEIHSERELLVQKQINGVELGWALGAGIALVSNAQLTCVA